MPRSQIPLFNLQSSRSNGYCYFPIWVSKPRLATEIRAHGKSSVLAAEMVRNSYAYCLKSPLFGNEKANEMNDAKDNKTSRSMPEEELVPLSEAKTQVENAITRIALLHLAFSKTLVEEFGADKGRELITRSVLRYGRWAGERMKRGLPDYPTAKYGAYIERERGRVYDCILAKIFREYNGLDIGGLYCYVDPAKSMAVDPNKKEIHNDCAAFGDEYCTFAVLPTTEKERSDFTSASSDWKYVDPRLARGTRSR
jgi:hypothetical protein